MGNFEAFKKLIFPGFGLLWLGAISFSFGEIPEWKEHDIGNGGGGSQGQTTIIDVDLDGDLDWMVKSDGQQWWEFDGYDPEGKPIWHIHKTNKIKGCATSAKAFDITGDGYPDQLSGRVWFENPGKNGDIKGPWKEHKDHGARVECADAVIGDWNHDEKLDVGFIGAGGQPSDWYDIPEDPYQKWGLNNWNGIKRHSGLAAGDLNGDGLLDVIIGKRILFSTKKEGTVWDEKDPAPWDGKGDTMNEIADIDGDGDMDIAMSAHWSKTDAVWFENEDGSGEKWIKHKIGVIPKLAHSVSVADIDHDGDLDIQMGSNAGAPSFWFENLGNKEFQAVAFTMKGPAHDLRVGDVDGDGDLDMIGKPWGKGNHFFYQNMLVENGGAPFDWQRGPMSSHNPFNPNRVKKDGCMDPDAEEYDMWAFHDGPIDKFCGATYTIQTGKTFVETHKILSQGLMEVLVNGPYSVSILGLDGKLIHSFQGEGPRVWNLRQGYQSAHSGIRIVSIKTKNQTVTDKISFK